MRGSQRRKAAQREGYRSAFEKEIADQAKKDGIKIEYEPEDSVIEWVPKTKKYLPDFVLKNGIVIEAKGRLTQQDRTKLLAVKEQYPEIDLRLVFMYDNKLSRESPTRYSEWAEKHGFKYAMKRIPKEWAKEKKTQRG